MIGLSPFCVPFKPANCKMEIIKGKREGTVKYIYDGYTYHLDKRNNIYRCANRKLAKCNACVMKKNDNFIIKHSHNHEENPQLVDIIKMKNDMLVMSKETGLRPKEIFDFVCRSNPLVGSHITYSSMRTILHRTRMSSFPPIPNSMEILKDCLLNYESLKDVYKGNVTSTNNEMAIIFSTNVLLDALSVSTEIYVDGTFSVVPQFPLIAQLYTIHIRYMETSIAAVYILCEKRTTSMYNAIWKRIKELAPNLEKNLEFIMSDYEVAAMSSMNENFPQSKIHGCWFHFNQAILRKWRQLGLIEAPSDLLSISMNIPLLPANLFPNAYVIMEGVANSLYSQYSNILKFLKYMSDNWLSKAEKVSTFGCPVRTNNSVESFHKIAAQKLRKPHSNIWIFLDNLKNLIIDQEIDFSRVQEGLNPRRIHMRANRERNTKIVNAQTALIEGRLPLQQFLYMFRSFNKQYLHQTEKENFEEGTLQEECNKVPLKELHIRLSRIDKHNNLHKRFKKSTNNKRNTRGKCSSIIRI